MDILAKARVIVIRAVALAAVLLTYAVGSVGGQVATTVGISTLALTTSVTPAGAWWRWGWRRSWRTPGWQGWGWRRGWRRCWWGEWC